MELSSRHLAAWLALVFGCASGSSRLGEHCGGSGDCASGLQCVATVCVPKCQRAPECGDGYSCDADGYCQIATGQPGDTCTSEVDCAAGLACELDPLGTHASCEPAVLTGRPAAARCNLDGDCANGTCALGRCVDLCRESRDCGTGTICTQIPRVEAAGAPFGGCLQAQGTLAWDIPILGPAADVLLPIPASARSVAVTFAIADPNEKVGATAVSAPDGTQLVSSDFDYFHQLARHEPELGQSVLAMPSSPLYPLQLGAYHLHVTSLRPPFSVERPGTATPTTTAVIKLDGGVLLDLHFYFLDFTDHPCAAASGGGTLDAKKASTEKFFQSDFLGELRAVFAPGNISLGTLAYTDVLGHPELDGLEVSNASSLLALGATSTGVNVFFVRTLSPAGLQAFGPPGPGPAGLANTQQSGIVVGLETLCYRTWAQVARLTAHEVARYMGLYDNAELGHVDVRDPIGDDTSSTNLMFYSEFGGTDLSPDQRDILSRSVVLR